MHFLLDNNTEERDSLKTDKVIFKARFKSEQNKQDT